jgi:hypothetical protein
MRLVFLNPRAARPATRGPDCIAAERLVRCRTDADDDDVQTGGRSASPLNSIAGVAEHTLPTPGHRNRGTTFRGESAMRLSR